MSAHSHWEHIYQTKSPPETSWYAPHLQISLEWILEAVPDRSASIVDIGGGESTLVDDLIAQGYRALAVLDISEAALAKSQRRLGDLAQGVAWIPGDVTEATLPERAYDLWHDRAVFHFLTEPGQRAAYACRLAASLKPGGQVVMATFGPEGPQKCSGLPTMRYDAEGLQRELGPGFRLMRQAVVDHQTPLGKTQQFLCCRFAFEPQE